MHSIALALPASGTAVGAGRNALEKDVITGLNLFLHLKSPAQMPALLATVQSRQQEVDDALAGLHYVHFARFLPTADGATLLVITEFDGDLKSYIMDFVAVLGDVFTAILAFVQDAPRLPVQRYPQDFWNFIQKNNIAQAQPWSAYARRTVIDIQGPRRGIAPAAVSAPPSSIDLADVQGNIVRGYRVHKARHFALAIGDAAGARRFVAALVGGDDARVPQVTTAALWRERPAYFMNIGFTAAGLRAFTQGPADAQRAAALGDVGDSEPARWLLGAPGQPAHVLLSLYTDEHQGTHLDLRSAQLRKLFADCGLSELSHHDAGGLPGGQVHFGYKDSISQPRIAGVPGHSAPSMQPECGAGEFLLGKDYVNQYGGNFIGDLPHALCDNASYAAVRMLQQDVAGFEALLQRVGRLHALDPELVAAKLLGRWRNGVPLMLCPDSTGSEGSAMAAERLNHFDYAPSVAAPKTETTLTARQSQ